MRLANGYAFNRGRLEVLYNNVWGAVCDRGFGLQDGRVACRQLGFSNVSQVYCCSYFGYSNRPMWLSNVACNGRENGIAECNYTIGNNTGCQRYQEVGLECTCKCNLII